MSATKLTKYLQSNPSVGIPPVSQKLAVPVVLSDSKGVRLQNQVQSPVAQNIVWWAKKSRTTQEGLTWLRSNIQQKLTLLGNIHIYVWLATCDLTHKTSGGRIALSAVDNTTEIIDTYKQFIDLSNSHPNCKLTFLEIPAYSISRWNKRSGAKPEQLSVFDQQDIDLLARVDSLNSRIKQLNSQLGVHAPNFNKDL